MTANLAVWLRDLGLDKYVDIFAENDLDLHTLPHLTEDDLRELGVSLGHRKILMAAIAQRMPSASARAAEPVTAESPPGRSADEAERRLVSILFCDLVGSTELARRLDPEDMRDILRRFEDGVAEVVSRYGGHVAQYLGDGVMACFGWPLSYEDHAERAVRSGLAALRAVRELRPKAGIALHARGGIATGRVVIGELVGSAARQDGAIAGETPNLAARLQTNADPDQLVISESTRRLLGDAFVIHDLPDRPLKGFEPGTRLYGVVREREVESRFQAKHGSVLSQFIGRVNELGLLREKWELAKSADGQAILLSGEAGIGKSRLVQAFIDGLGSEPHAILRSQCSPYHNNSALFPFIQTIGRLSDFNPDDANDVRLDKLERMLIDAGADLPAVVPVYAELLSVDLRARYAKLELSPEQHKNLTFQTIIDRLLTRARRSPLLLFMEDAHWIDPTSRELLEALIAQIENAPVMLLITHRPNWEQQWSSTYGHVLPLSLGRLARPQVAELIRSIAGTTADEGLVVEITRRTDGIPLFVEELTRSVIESKAEDRERKPEIPATLQGSLMARLDRLPAEAKKVAQVAAVIGREFSRSLLARVCDSPANLDTALRELLEARLVFRVGTHDDALVFKHALIQDAAYHSLLTSNRQRYHEAIARTLAEERLAITGVQPELVAHHFSEAALPDKAFPFWLRAGEHALARSANFEAVDHYRRALHAAGRLPDPESRSSALLESEVGLGQAQAAAGHLHEAMITFHRAGKTAQEQGNMTALAKCAIGFDQAQFFTAEPNDPAIKVLSEALAAMDEKDSHERCQVLVRLGRALHMSGDRERADPFTLKAIEMAHRLHDDRSLFEVLFTSVLTTRAFSLTEMHERRKRLDQLVAIAERAGDTERYVRALSARVFVAAEAGDGRRLAADLDEYHSQSERGQMRHCQWVEQHGRAMQAVLAGDFAAAEKFAEAAHTLGGKTHGEIASGVYGMQMFTIRREQGRLVDVAPIIKRFIDAGNRTWRPGFALIASDLGFKEQAQRIVDELRENDFDFPFDAKRSTTLSYLAEVCAALGDQVSARKLFALLEPYRHMTITAGMLIVCYGSAGRFLGELADAFADWDGAEEHFEDALRMNRDMEAWPWLAHTQHRFARMLRRRGRTGDIKRIEELLSQSWTTASQLGMIALKESLRRDHH
jgi:class 3 adenylate cyclase/tetratricopeptide (TPR) repeat protein